MKKTNYVKLCIKIYIITILTGLDTLASMTFIVSVFLFSWRVCRVVVGLLSFSPFTYFLEGNLLTAQSQFSENAATIAQIILSHKET